ncbi:MAG: hypothetical protein MSG64_10300 [Pyrinomonadaceae bacterium MAG19_C2-C3]|nr:hypothetical protein [Pyrinomonadaceae bacterium MAG19_C2-C3]
MPNTAQGAYYVFVVTDAIDAIEECATDGNNIGASRTQINISNRLPNLRVTGINPLGGAVAGSTITVQWAGQNAGDGDARNPSWIDRVYLSTDNTLDGGDRRLGAAIINGGLAVGATYQAQAQVTLPILAPGNYFVIVAADADNYVFEGQRENDNANSTALTVIVPEIDLLPGNVNAPDTAFSGQNMTVTWTVTNTGAQPTVGASWTDYVFLSRDQILDPTDRAVGFLQHNGALNGGEGYNASLGVTVPAGLTGTYFVFVVTDWHNRIAESLENNNTATPDGVMLQLSPPADLVASSVVPPATGTPGELATFEWTIRNGGSNPALGVWEDAVYLSLNETWDINDALVGRLTHNAPVAPGATYAGRLTAVLPAVNPGRYFVIVRADVRNRVRETDETNNVTASTAQTLADVLELQLGVPRNFTFTGSGAERFFRINAPANETMLVTLDGQDGASNELFTRFGQMVSRSAYDFQFSRPYEPDQEVTVPNTQAGTYYNLARADHIPSAQGNEAATIKAEIIPFSIRSVSPNRIGDNGQVTITLKGAKFENGATVQLIQGGTVLTAGRVIVLENATVKARFIFSNASHGQYDVVLRNPDGATTTALKAVTIETATRLLVDLNATAELRPRVGGQMTADGVLFNHGNVDAPYVRVTTAFSGNVTISYRRPVGTLPRQSDLTGPNGESLQSTNVAFDGTTNDGFVVRDLEPGQRIPFTVIVRNYARGRFTAEVDVYAQSKQEFETETRASLELLRQALLETSAVLPTAEQTAIVSADAWWQYYKQSLVDSGFLDVEIYENHPDSKVASSINEESTINLIEGETCPDRCLNLYKKQLAIIAGFYAACEVIAELLPAPEPRTTAKRGCKLAASNATAAAAIVYKCCLLLCTPPPPCEEVSLARKLCGTLAGGIRICGDAPPAGDPNDKQSPAGYGPQAFIPVRQSLPYTINFENVQTVTATAQRIRITDQLDANLDWRTFRLKEIGFGNYRVTVPENRAFFLQRVQLGAEFNNLLGDISAGVDIATGQVTWTLTAIDPATGEQPNSALLGLLPPNDETNRGQGFVTYTIQPKANAPTGTIITNNATIIFDTEEPITTNTVSNTLDADSPTSRVSALPSSSPSSTFTIQWSGDDPAGGSGLQSYDIWVSENGGSYQPFVTATTDTSAQFTGRLGSSYRFYSVARDNAGNVEATPAMADATIRVGSKGRQSRRPRRR